MKVILFLHDFIQIDSDDDTLIELSNFIDKFSINDPYILGELKTLIENSMEYIVDNDLNIEVGDYINYSHEPGEIDCYEIDSTGIENEVDEMLNSYLDGFNKSVLENYSSK